VHVLPGLVQQIRASMMVLSQNATQRCHGRDQFTAQINLIVVTMLVLLLLSPAVPVVLEKQPHVLV
jgi:hypothetical protein